MADEGAESCLICADDIVFSACNMKCKHETCMKCSLRLRELYSDLKCVVCKVENPEAVYTDAQESATPAQAKSGKKLDRKSKAYFGSPAVADAVQLLRACKCPDCDEVLPSLMGLKKHAKSHRKVYCQLCMDHRKVFPSELKMMTPAELDVHMKQGDDKQQNTGFKGHPLCEFCNRRFYSDDELFTHLNKEHEQCHICRRNSNRSFDYFRNYRSLEEHFRCDHYLCEELECLEKRFVVFSTEFEYQAHMAQYHSGGGSSRGVKVNLMDLGLTVPSYRNESNNLNWRSDNGQHHRRQNGRRRGPRPFTPAFASSQGTDDARTGGSNQTTGPSNSSGSNSGSNSGSSRSSRSQMSTHDSDFLRGSGETPSAAPSVKYEIPKAPATRAELEERNRQVVARMKQMMAGRESKFKEFRDMSAQFRGGKVSPNTYYTHFIEILGQANKDDAVNLFLELAMLLPDVGKRNQLLAAFKHANPAQDASSGGASGGGASSGPPVSASDPFYEQASPASTRTSEFPSLPGASSSSSSSTSSRPTTSSVSQADWFRSSTAAPTRAAHSVPPSFGNEAFPSLPASQPAPAPQGRRRRNNRGGGSRVPSSIQVINNSRQNIPGMHYR